MTKNVSDLASDFGRDLSSNLSSAARDVGTLLTKPLTEGAKVVEKGMEGLGDAGMPMPKREEDGSNGNNGNNGNNGDNGDNGDSGTSLQIPPLPGTTGSGFKLNMPTFGLPKFGTSQGSARGPSSRGNYVSSATIIAGSKRTSTTTQVNEAQRGGKDKKTSLTVVY